MRIETNRLVPVEFKHVSPDNRRWQNRSNIPVAYDHHRTRIRWRVLFLFAHACETTLARSTVNVLCKAAAFAPWRV